MRARLDRQAMTTSRIRTALPLVVVALAIAATGVANTPASASSRTVVAPYDWPVKPFHMAHPIRANFGDPRTTFLGAPTMHTLMTSNGIFEDHFGIDISVPDGTPVYAVRSGVVGLPNARVVSVDAGGGFITQYWHIIPTVKAGDHVDAYRTVLGHVMKGYEHVHFTELDNGVAVNPLERGHLAPYADGTRPKVASILFRESDTGAELLPEYVHGRVVMIANASDMPALPVPGIWADLPVAPALITWRIERAGDGKVVVPSHTAFDVRETLPSTPFWAHYARGTRQNMANFQTRRAWREPGVYLYKLTTTAFDSNRLPNGIYRLVVTASDIRGNSGSSGQIFIVHNGNPL